MAQIQDAVGTPILEDKVFLNTLLSALNSALEIPIAGQACAAIQVEGIGTLTLAFEATVDGTDWFPIYGVVPGTGAVATTTTANGIWIFEVGAFTKFRARVSAYTSGSASVSGKASQGTTVVQLAAGSVSISMSQYAEDTPAAAAENVLMAGVVRKDVAASLVDTDGDRTELQVDASGALRVTGGGGGTEYADGAVRGTATGTLAMGDDGVNIQSVKVDSSGRVAIQDDGGSITVDGTVSVSEPVSVDDNAGSLTVDSPQLPALLAAGGGLKVEGVVGGVAVPISAATLPLPTGAATSALQLPDGHNVTVDNAAGAAAVNVQDGGNSITIDGSVGVNNAGGASAVNIQDGGNSITVDGSVSITGTPTVDTELPTAAALADNTANPTVPGVGAFLMAYDGTNWDRVQTGAAASGALKVDGSAVTQPISAASLPLPTGAATSALQTQPGVDIGDVTVNNAAGASAVNVQDGGNSLTIDAASLPLPTGAATAALQTQPGVDIGDVTVNNVAGTNSVPVQGNTAHDAAVAGNPVVIAARANLDEPATPVAAGDVTHLWADLHGRLVVLDGHANPAAPVSLNATAIGNTTVIAAPGVGVSVHVCKASVHNRASSPNVVALTDGAGGTVRWRAELGSNGGGSLIDFGSHGWSLTSNTALVVNLLAAGDVDVNITDHYLAP